MLCAIVLPGVTGGNTKTHTVTMENMRFSRRCWPSHRRHDVWVNRTSCYGEKNLAHLKTLKGAAFDKAYVDHEVTYHQQVIDALDKTLIPGATNEELKALLIKVRPAFVAHLEHAKHLQASTGKDS